MTSIPPGASRGAGQALAEIHSAEARRMLDLPIGIDLAAAAQQWVVDGISTRNTLALAGAGNDVSDGVRIALLRQLAVEVGATFSTTREARAFEANGIIKTMSEGGQVSEQLFGLSNGFTDEFTARVRRFFARLLGRTKS